KAIARDTALKIGKKYTEINVIIAHMGGGVTVGAHKKGRVIDVNNGLDGDGPFSPERSGSVPVGDLVKTAFSGDYTLSDMKKLINGHGGLIAYMGTHDLRVVEDKVNKGDKDAELIYEAMAYQIAKEIGSCATVLKGDVQAISLTGGLAQSKPFTALIIERVDFIAPVHIFPGEQEMRALALGALRVLQGEEEAKIY
ncbi:MAG: butyrate kinase, partial [Calditrichaceae bacterium]